MSQDANANQTPFVNGASTGPLTPADAAASVRALDLLSRVQAACAADSPWDAIDACYATIRDNPHDLTPLQLLDQIFDQIGETAARDACREELRNRRTSALSACAARARLALNQGDALAAIVAWREAITLDPSALEAHLGLGLALQELGQLDGAAACFQWAHLIAPNAVAPLSAGAELARLRGKPDQALDALEGVIQRDPRQADAWNDLGTLWLGFKDGFRARSCFERALHIEPRQTAAHCNLAQLELMHQWPEAALRWADAAIASTPLFAHAHQLRGNALKRLGRAQEAVAAYSEALRLRPEDNVARYELANAQRSQGEVTSALATYDELLLRDPSHTAAQLARGNVLKLLDDVAAARKAYADVLARFPHEKHWELWLASLLPHVSDSHEAIRWQRSELQSTLLRLLPAGLKLDWRELASCLCAPPYTLQFHGLDNKLLKTIYARVLAPSFAQAGEFEQRCRERRARESNNGRLRLGCIATGGHEGVFLRCMRGIVTRLVEHDIECVVGCSLAAVERVRQELADDRITVVPLPDRFDLAVDTVAGMQCDVLYYWEIGSDTLNYLLPFVRLAPVQCTGWGLPDTSGIPNVDAFLSCAQVETPNADSHYSEKLHRAPWFLTWQDRQREVEPALARRRFGWDDATTIYACVQQIPKLHPDMDALFADILRRDRAGRLVLVGDTGGHWAAKLLARLERSMPDLLSRVQLLPRLNVADYRRLVAASDVLLDTRHFGGGITTYDAFACGKPLVTWPGKFRRSRYAVAWYDLLEFQDLHVASHDAYVNAAVSLGRDRTLRNDWQRRLFDASDVVFENPRSVTAFASAIRQLHEQTFHSS